MNTYSKDLCHWGIEKGGEREGHKYLARVEIKPGKYLYFYDLAKYNAWKNGAKNKAQEVGNKVKASAQKMQKAATPAVNKLNEYRKKTGNQITKKLLAAKIKADEASNKYKDKITKEAKTVSEKVKERADEGKKAVLKSVNAAKEEAIYKVKDIKESAVNHGKNLVLNTKEQAKRSIDKNTKKIEETVNKAKEYVNKHSATTLNGTNVDKSLKEKVKNFISNLANAYSVALGTGLYNIVHLRDKDETPVIHANPGKKKGDYYAEIEYPNGKKIKIKTKEDWKRFAEVYKYQNNEPEFMYSTPEIKLRDDGTLPSDKEDKTEVNDKWPSGYRSVNCIFCSTAYELRRRGYDVEAANLPSDINMLNISTLFNVKDSTLTQGTTEFKTSQPIDMSSVYGSCVIKDVKLTVHGFEYTYSVKYNDLKNNDNNVKSFVMAKDVENAHAVVTSSASSKEKQVWKDSVIDTINKTTSDFPEDSRGMINVYWKDGGGHSMIWEKDESGRIKIYDTQINEPVSIMDLMESVSPYAPIQFIRTDDLELSRTAMLRVTSN